MRARSALVVAALAAVALASCDPGPSRNTSLSDVVESADPEKLADQMTNQGLPLHRIELICLFDALLDEPDLTVGDIEDYSKNPDPNSPVAAAYQRIVPGCLRPELSVANMTPEPAIREQLERALVATGFTEEEATCYFDYVFDHDVTLREFVLASYGLTPGEADSKAISDAADACVGSASG